ncbi:DUF2628 domain-containing protein [Nitratireductor sp. ZSWI3]|uniref:DUF2628 domain-containing protein n=1 Tax=Nitratireductor sp. ZSWI3 TaxID=2966359 RepID=UPI00214F810B|nr:DUF2628 domain-containing protein [Nitratireductor sp. ZSWI3]MCR4265682.1 DUF2628 domain-containing protein [Nitratireductor sp. ZSWI3]
MASYVVMEPPQEGPENALLLRDGFAFLAFIIPFFWFLWHRMWLEAFAVLAVALLLGALGSIEGWSATSTVASLCLSLFLGLEARNLRAAMLRRRGWRQWGVVEADNRSDAETRFMAELFAGSGPAPTPSAPVLSDAAVRGAGREGNGPALGLFTYPGAG